MGKAVWELGVQLCAHGPGHHSAFTADVALGERGWRSHLFPVELLNNGRRSQNAHQLKVVYHSPDDPGAGSRRDSHCLRMKPCLYIASRNTKSL